MVVAFTSISTVLSVRYFLRSEMKASQLSWFNNFSGACTDALYLGDDLAIQAYSESFEKSIPELAYAIFVDESRAAIRLGGLESLQRFDKLSPACMARPGLNGEPAQHDSQDADQRWRHFCEPITQTNLRGDKIHGTVFIGFNMNMLDLKLESIVSRMWPWLMWSMVGVLIVGLIGSFLLAERLTRPILHLTQGAKAIGDGDLQTQIPVESSDELGFLAQEFNLMATKLRELDQLKDDFVSSVSHELRSPLSAISGYVELLRSKPLNEITAEKGTKALNIIQESTMRLTSFINDILDLAKLKAGQVEIRSKPISVKDVAEDVMALMQPLLEKKSINFSVDVPVNVPEFNADEDKVRQVIQNLISNALKFTPSGGKIRIFARNQSDFVQISVEDSGVGIPDDAKQIVFEKFRQAKNRSDPAGPKGTGLGLAIAKGNVEAHGGRIWLESEVNKGTTVHFTLPLSSNQAKPTEPA